MTNKTKNLKPIQKGELSKEEAKKRGQKGGIKSGEVRREKRQLKEILETFLEMDAPPKMKDKALEIIPELDNERLSLKASLVVTLIEKILNGDMKAFELMRDTIGEKPIEKQEITQCENNIQTFSISESECNDTEKIIEKLKLVSDKIIKFTFIPRETEIKFDQYIDAFINDDPKANELARELFGCDAQQLINKS